jgi:hypothetical protein
MPSYIKVGSLALTLWQPIDAQALTHFCAQSFAVQLMDVKGWNMLSEVDVIPICLILILMMKKYKEFQAFWPNLPHLFWAVLQDVSLLVTHNVYNHLYSEMLILVC